MLFVKIRLDQFSDYYKPERTIKMSEEMNNVNEELENEPTILLSLDDGTEVVCVVLSIYEIDGQEYIALLPQAQEDEEAEEMDVYIYRFAEDEEGNPLLDNIEDDEEYQKAVDTFNALLDSQEFEE